MLSNIATQTTKSIQDNCTTNEKDQPLHLRETGNIEVTSTNSYTTNTTLIDEEEQSNVDPITRRMDPKCENDIKLLYSELNLWRTQQFEEIEQMRDITVEDRIHLRSKVLSKETFLLRKISTMGKGIRLTNEKSLLESKLDKIANPIRWTLSNGEKIEVIKASIEHSCELVRMYQKYSCESDQNVAQRLRLLTEAKEMLQTEENSVVVKEICGLLDREKDLLRRGMTHSLPGLRKRILNLLLHFIEATQDVEKD